MTSAIRRRAVLALVGDLRTSDINRTLLSLLDELGRTGAVDPARTRVVAGEGGALAASAAASADLAAVRVVGGAAERAGRVAAKVHPRARATGERIGLSWGLARTPARGVGGPPDVVWAHGADTLALAEALPRPARRAPLVVRLPEGPAGLAQAAGSAAAEQLGHARLVVVATEVMRRHLVDDLAVPASRVAVHPPWALPTAEVDADPPVVPAGALVVAGVGPVGWQAGTDLFLDLVARLPESVDGRPVHAVWVGPAADPDAAERVAVDVGLRGLTGRVQVVDAPTWAAGWPPPAVAVVSARESPLPLAALDLARRSVPVVGAATSGLAEVLPDAVHDVLVPPFATAELAALVTELLGSVDARRSLGAEQQAHVARHHQPEARIGALWADVASHLARG